MNLSHRRMFLEDVGRGMLLASVGPALALDLGIASVRADDEPKPLHFGDLEPLVALLQETSKEKLLPLLAAKHKEGTGLRQLTAAASFANARTFGGEDYFGFHTFMALAPAYQIAQEMPKDEQPLPIWKVLYRNAHYTEKHGGRKQDVLRAIEPTDTTTAEQVREAVNRGNGTLAERRLATLAKQSPQEALDSAILGVEDNCDVHTAVLPWRAWTMLDFVGPEHAVTMLRQSVRQTSKQCANTRNKDELASARKLLPKLLDQHKLLDGPKGQREAEDRWIETMCETVLTSKPDLAGDAVAAALAEGFSPEQVGEAISLAANQLVLRQVENWAGANYGKRTHGDSPGVHMSDETNAWRNIARVSNPRNRAVGLILAAVDIAKHYEYSMSRKPAAGHQKEPFPWKEHLTDLKANTADEMLKQLDGAVRENNQIRACALVHNYGQSGFEAKAIFNLLRQFAISEDGRLHGEKYYRTVVEEFATTRSAFRWRQLMALARVTASAYGFSQQDKQEGRAPGYDESRKLLGI